MSNHFAVPNGTDNLLYRNVDSALAANARAVGINAAGMPVGTEIAERGPARASDGDQVFAKALSKAYDTPHGLEKSEVARDADDVIDLDDPASVTDLIRKAHGDPAAIEDLPRGYRGRELSKIAKAAATKESEVTAATLDDASPTLRKVLGDFDAIVRRQIARRPV